MRGRCFHAIQIRCCPGMLSICEDTIRAAPNKNPSFIRQNHPQNRSLKKNLSSATPNLNDPPYYTGKGKKNFPKNNRTNIYKNRAQIMSLA